MLNTETIDESVAAINTPDAARAFMHTIISEFQDKYTIEDPDNVKKYVKPAVEALQKLQRKGYDMHSFAVQLLDIAMKEYKNYTGQDSAKAYRSTLIVTDFVTHKKSTGYWKKKDKK